MLRALLGGARESLATLRLRTRIAWQWDLLTGAFAGVYQGCVWTFVMRVARADMRATGEQIAWITAAPALGYVFATLWARQMDGKSKLPFVYWTWVVARGAFLFAPLIHTRGQYVTLVCATPILFSISAPAYTAVMKEIYPDRHRGRLMSMVRMLMNICMLFTALTMGRLLDHGLDFRIAFTVGGMCGAMTAATFSRIPLKASREPSEPRMSACAFCLDTLHILWRNPGYRWFTASVFVFGFGNIIAATLYPIYQVDRFNITNTEVANMQNIAAIVTIGAFIFWGHFLDRRGPLTTVLLGICFNVCTPLVYALAGDVHILYIAAAMQGMAGAGIDLGYLNTTLMFAEPGKVSQYQALHSSFFGIRGTIAPLLAIPLKHALAAQGTFYVSIGVMCGGLLLQIISMRDFRRQAAKDLAQVVSSQKRVISSQ